MGKKKIILKHKDLHGIYMLPGKRLRRGDLVKLAGGEGNICSRLRDPGWYRGKVICLCALQGDEDERKIFKRCNHPDYMLSPDRYNCPVEQEFDKRMQERGKNEEDLEYGCAISIEGF